MTVVDASELRPGTSDFAIEFWTTTTDTTSNVTIIDKRDSGVGYEVGLAAGYLKFSLYGSSTKTFTATGSQFSSTEKHVVINVDRTAGAGSASLASGYVNGAVATSATVDVSALSDDDINNTTNIVIGNFVGTLRHIRYYNRLLSADEIAYNYANPELIYSTSGLQMWLKCGEGEGVIAHDSSGKNNHAYFSTSDRADMYWKIIKRKGIYLCLDKNGALWKRENDIIFTGSALAIWDNKLVIGCGDNAGSNPNLVYFDKNVITEVFNPLTSTYHFPTVGAESDEFKSLRRYTLVYQDRQEHDIDTGFVIYYRVDDGSWTTLDTFISSSTDTATQLTGDGEYHVVNRDCNLRTDGKLWEFKIESTADFKIVGFTPHVEYEPKVTNS